MNIRKFLLISIFAIGFVCGGIVSVFADTACANLPSGYTQVEYLTSTGSQYITTSVYFDITKNFRVIGEVINPNVSYRKVIVGNYYGDDYASYSLEFGGNSNSYPGYFRHWIASRNYDSGANRFANSAQPVNTLISYDSNYNATNRIATESLTYNGSTQTFSWNTVTTSTTTIRSLRFFLDYRSNASGIAYPISIGRTKMYKADVLVGDFIPAKCNSDNVFGMYDLVSGNFLINGGSGTFSAGSVVPCNTTITLTFDGVSTTPSQCTYGGTFVPPTPAARPGYIFTGWKVKTVNP